ncbi:MAG: hypothetical protein WCK67_09120 [bacterium]
MINKVSFSHFNNLSSNNQKVTPKQTSFGSSGADVLTLSSAALTNVKNEAFAENILKLAKESVPDSLICVWQKTEKGLISVWKKSKDILRENTEIKKAAEIAKSQAKKAELNEKMKTYPGFVQYFERCLEKTHGDKAKALELLSRKVAKNHGFEKIILDMQGPLDNHDLSFDNILKMRLEDLYAINGQGYSFSKRYKAGDIKALITPGHGCGFGENWMGVYKYVDQNFKPGDKILVSTCDNLMPSHGTRPITSSKLVIAHQHGNRYIEPESYKLFGGKTYTNEELLGENEELSQKLKELGYKRTKRADGNYWIELLEDKPKI